MRAEAILGWWKTIAQNQSYSEVQSDNLGVNLVRVTTGGDIICDDHGSSVWRL